MINALVLTSIAPQGFRPGLRTDAPIRGLNTGFQTVESVNQKTDLLMGTLLIFKLLNFKL